MDTSAYPQVSHLIYLEKYHFFSSAANGGEEQSHITYSLVPCHHPKLLKGEVKQPTA